MLSWRPEFVDAKIVVDTVHSSRLRRFYRSKAVSFILRSWSIALLLGTLTFFLLNFQPDRFLFKLTDSSSFVPDTDRYRRFYQDLNSDGKTEYFSFANISENASCLVVSTPLGIVIDQWNFKGIFSTDLYDQIYTDYDHSGGKEISIITIDENRIYLNIIEPFGTVPILVKDRLIDTLWTKYGQPMPVVYHGSPADLNHDGSNEIVFAFNAGHARQPRRVYAYDIKADSLWSSSFAGSVIGEPKNLDLDRDGRIEISGNCFAPYNYTDESIELPDSISWFIVLDEQLKYKVPPRPMGPNFSMTMPVRLPVQDSLVDFVFVASARDTLTYFDWYRILPDYSLKKEIFQYNPGATHAYSFAYPAYSVGGMFFNRFDKALFINASGKVSSNPKFPKRVIPVEVLNPSDGLRDFEYCLLVDGKNLRIAFYSLEGKELGSIDNINYADLISLSWVGQVNGRHQLFLSDKDLFQWYEVRRNPWQYFQYLIWILLIGSFYGFIELIRFSAANEIARREELRKELLELQLKSVKNQLDPHFTFNALNGLSYLALSGDTVKMTNFIDHFSHLLRTHLNSSDKALVKLGDEIEFLENYMELQRMRFDDLIKLELDIQPEIDLNMMVPKMMLQTHVENAVKHGLRPKFSEHANQVGMVRVSVFKERAKTVILIEDNGFGRGNAYASPKEESTGRGLQVLEQIFSAVWQLYRIEITQKFEDLKDESGKPAGTRVKMKICYR